MLEHVKLVDSKVYTRFLKGWTFLGNTMGNVILQKPSLS